MNRQQRRVRLQAEGVKKTLYLTGVFDFIKAKNSDNLTRVSILAYTGGALKLDGFEYPIVIDLASTTIAPRVPILWSHDREIILGEIEGLAIVGATVPGIGILNGAGDKADEIRKMVKDGYKFNVSAGTATENMTLVESGTRLINGQLFSAPFYHAKENVIREISILSIGADENAFATLLAASLGTSTDYGTINMKTFEEFLASLSLDINAMSEADKLLAKKIYDNMIAAKAKLDAQAKPVVQPNGDAVPPTVDISKLVADATKQVRDAIATEHVRVDKIKVLSSTYSNPTACDDKGVRFNIAAKAIADNWNLDQTELLMMRNARITTINAGGRNGNGGDNEKDRFTILAAAVAISGKMKNPEKHFAAPILEAAHKEYKGRIGLQQLLLEAAYANGYTGKANFKANIKAILQAAFSTIDIADLLTNNVNKYLWEGFMSVDDKWRLIAKIGSVSDFKEVTGYRGVGSFKFEKLAPDGHIPHGTMSDTPYGNKADTYGKMLGVTRVDMINDDLNALTGVPRGLGRGGVIGLIEAFWTEFMDNGAFFVAGNNNVSAGALGIAGLAAANNVFMKQTDENGDYILATPRYLVVPTELEPQAMDLYSQTNLVGGNTTTFGQNRYAGKFQPVSTPYLSDSRFTGNSTTAYYLIADPNDIPVIEVVFLDGVEQPTVETADVDFDQLGIQMRGFWDWGVRLQEPRGGVRSTGV